MQIGGLALLSQVAPPVRLEPYFPPTLGNITCTGQCLGAPRPHNLSKNYCSTPPCRTAVHPPGTLSPENTLPAAGGCVEEQQGASKYTLFGSLSPFPLKDLLGRNGGRDGLSQRPCSYLRSETLPLSDPTEIPPLSRDRCSNTPVALCFLWYRRLSLLHPHFFP